MITEWSELVENEMFKLQLTKLVKECDRYRAVNELSVNRWETIIDNLRHPRESWLSLAHLTRALYYWECSMDESIQDRRSYMSASKKDIDKCLSLIGARKWTKSDSTFAIICYVYIIVPWFIIFFYAGSIHALYASKREQDIALKYFSRYHQAIFKRLAPDTHLELLSFRRYSEYCLSDIIEEKITSMPPKVMNDCIDSLLFPWMDFRIKELVDLKQRTTNPTVKNRIQRSIASFNLFKESMDSYRIRSFVDPGLDLENVKNPLMWAHYADEHRGIAILYSFDSSKGNDDDNKSAWMFKDIIYANTGTKIDLSRRVIDIETGLLTKSSDWKYENEVRLITYDSECKSIYKQSELGVIKRVFFGIRCPDQTISSIMKLLANSDVDFYQMKTEETDILCFSYEKI